MKFADSSTSDGLTKVSGSVLSEEDEAIWNTPKPTIITMAEQWTGVCTDGRNATTPAIRLIIWIQTGQLPATFCFQPGNDCKTELTE